LPKHQSEFASRSEKIAAILFDVSQHHLEHLDAICERAGIGTSRRYELLEIGAGRKTIAQSREETAARQRKFKAKKKKAKLAAKPKDSVTTPPVTEKATEHPKAGNGTDPDESAATMKAAHAANEGNGEARKVSKGKSASKPKSDKSKAKSEFAYACDHWLPLMSKHDQAEALKYAKDVIERQRVPADIVTDAPIDASKLN
jgi:hypothetical protein